MLKLEKQDWDFSSVPDDELPACLLWEYGRECRTFVHRDEFSEAETLIKPKQWSVKLQKWIPNSIEAREYAKYQQEYLKEIGFNYESFLEKYEAFDLCYTRVYEAVISNARPWSNPWQAMPAKWREQIKVEAINPSVFGPISFAWVGDLEALWELNSEDLKQIRLDQKKINDPKDDSEEFALYSETKPFVKNKKDSQLVSDFTAAFAIDFKKFTDAEICDTFLKWLKELRPKEISAPTRRGKKYSDARSALEWLGIMRALHHLQWRSPQFPNPFRLKGESVCYKARKQASRKLHELFPFIEKWEKPQSWLTKADIEKRQRQANSR